MAKKYNFEGANNKNIVKARSANTPISLKYSVELGRELKGMRVNKAEKLLQDIIEHKRFLPLRKYKKKIGHRKGNAVSFTKTGRYPERTCQQFLNLLASVKANADYRGFNSDNLIIVHVFASNAFRRRSHQKQGRINGKIHLRKSIHLEIAVVEAK